MEKFQYPRLEACLSVSLLVADLVTPELDVDIDTNSSFRNVPQLGFLPSNHITSHPIPSHKGWSFLIWVYGCMVGACGPCCCFVVVEAGIGSRGGRKRTASNIPGE